jgi:hypothetical protein
VHNLIDRASIGLEVSDQLLIMTALLERRKANPLVEFHGRDAGRIADEVIAHLLGLVGSSVKVTLEIEADVSGGVPENVVRTVTENSRTLKFNSYGFEQE